MSRAVIIAAGGVGTRMKSGIPKQFLLLNGLPVIMHSMLAFRKADPKIKICLAVPHDTKDYWDELCNKYDLLLLHSVFPGGETRFHSVQNVITNLDDEGWVAIHDSARPLISPQLISRLFQEAEKFGTAIPSLPVTDSLRVLKDNRNSAVPRSSYRIIQTPQIFQTYELKIAYQQPFQEPFTDDATVYESYYQKNVHLTDGDSLNIKITNPEDFRIAEKLLQIRTD